MRRKRETSLQESAKEPPVRGKRKRGLASDNEAQLTDTKTSNEHTPGKSKSRRKAKDSVVVSKYFQTAGEKVPEDRPLLLNKRGKGKSDVDINGLEGKESNAENEFEESTTIYRSPSLSKASKQKVKKSLSTPVTNEKKSYAKKRKGDETEKVKPVKRKKKSEKDEINDVSDNEDKLIHEDNESDMKQAALEEKPELKKRGKRDDTKSHTDVHRRTKKNTEEIYKDFVSDVKKKHPDAEAVTKKTKAEKETTVVTKKTKAEKETKAVTKTTKAKKETKAVTKTTEAEKEAKAVTKTTKAKKETKGVTKKGANKDKQTNGVMPESLPVQSLPKTFNQLDVTAVLLHMEGAAKVPLTVQPSTSSGEAAGDDDDVMSESDDSDEDSGEDDKEAESEDSGEEEDWEEVADHHGSSPRKSQIPDKPVEFTLEAPHLFKKKKKGEFDWKLWLKRKVNRFKKEVAMDVHKVHLLCLTARCRYLNTIYQDDLLKAQALSIVVVTRELTVMSVERCTTDQLGKLFAWMQQAFTADKAGGTSDELTKRTLRENIQNCLQTRYITSQLQFISVCVLLFRQIGFNTRLLMSLQPLPFKDTSAKKSGKGKAPAKKSNSKTGSQAKSEKSASKSSASKSSASKTKSNENTSKPSKVKGEKVTKTNNGARKNRKSAKPDTKTDDKKSGANKKRSRRRCSKELPGNVYKDENADVDSEDEYTPKADENSGEESDKKGKGKAKHKKGNKDSEDSIEENDSDFEEDSILIRTQSLVRKSPGSKNKKVLSSDSNSSLDSMKGADEWLEVYLEKEQRWICIDCVTGRLGKPYDIERNATQPVSYVIGIDNDGYMKDVTQRYASQWLTSTRKLRVDPDWWTDTLGPHRCPDLRLDKLEDQDVESALQKRPLPTSIGDFKSHPLYALERHLLKFEAIYPPSAVPLGYIRSEPVYARECVYTLHSRENWLKEGRAVRIGEEPYKYVKSRPKWNKPKENPEAKDLEIFGIWQTELYIPPPAVDGKVPRNAHGNVEMFLPTMLPAGTVHLQLAGLNKIAKKLDIDCAPAMIGWDHHCGFSHPLMDGFIVCEEFKDILLAAWDEEQLIIQEKEAAKREKRVYENWRKLIRGLLIRERLKKRFDLEGDKKDTEAGTSTTETKDLEKVPDKSEVKTEGPKEKATDVQYAWPQNRMKTDTTTYKVEQI